MAAFGKTRRRRELPLKSGLKKVERQLCADSGHLCGVQNLGLWALSSHSPQSDLMSALIQYLKRRHGAKGRGIGPGSLNLFLELFQLSVPARATS